MPALISCVHLGLSQVHAFLPAMESFGFETDLRTHTSGQARAAVGKGPERSTSCELHFPRLLMTFSSLFVY